MPSDNEILNAYLAECFPSIAPESITDEFMLEVWHKRAKSWYKERTATGFELALVEFKKLQGCRHWSRRRTLEQAREAFRRAGILP